MGDEMMVGHGIGLRLTDAKAKELFGEEMMISLKNLGLMMNCLLRGDAHFFGFFADKDGGLLARVFLWPGPWLPVEWSVEAYRAAVDKGGRDGAFAAAMGLIQDQMRMLTGRLVGRWGLPPITALEEIRRGQAVCVAQTGADTWTVKGSSHGRGSGVNGTVGGYQQLQADVDRSQA